MENTGEYYLINHLTLFTGLTDRTIRSHIAAGFLQGEKINGLWHFTPEQVDQFLRHSAVRPGILAKNNAIIYDFLADGKKQEPCGCFILDLPGVDTKNARSFSATKSATAIFTTFGSPTTPRAARLGSSSGGLWNRSFRW